MSFGVQVRNGVALGLGTVASLSSAKLNPAYSLNFLSGVLDPSITFTRSTTATYYNSSGLLASAAINAARFDYNPQTLAPRGLLIEEGRTNFFTWSNDATNAAWTKSALTPTISGTSPDGSANANVLTGDGTSAAHYIIQGGTASASGTVVSGYFKAGTNNFVQLFCGTDTAPFANFDLVNGVVGSVGATSTGTIQNVGNGWYRCILATTSATAAGGGCALIAATTDARAPTNTLATTVNMYGMQDENGAFPTSYIPTTTVAVARGVESAVIGTLSPWFTQAQGTFLISSVMPQMANTPADLGITGASSNMNTGGSITGWYNGTTNLAVANSVGLNVIRKEAMAYTGASRALCVNGGTVATSATAGLGGSATAIHLGDNGTTGNQTLNGWVRSFAFYSAPLSNPQLQALTT